MADFIKSFGSDEEKRSFTHWFFKNDFDGKRIRRDLYESVLFPILFEGYKNSDAWSVKVLAETEQNLFEAQHLWQQIGNKTKLVLLRQYLNTRPNDYTARRKLLAEQVSAFKYCEQEWPGAIIFGPHEATAPECDKLFEEVAFARKLDVELKYKTYIDEFESKLETYRKRFRR
jgi:hypothetical protein